MQITRTNHPLRSLVHPCYCELTKCPSHAKTLSWLLSLCSHYSVLKQEWLDQARGWLIQVICMKGFCAQRRSERSFIFCYTKGQKRITLSFGIQEWDIHQIKLLGSYHKQIPPYPITSIFFMAQQWSPTMCIKRGCTWSKHVSNKFFVHGLWPTNVSET